MCFNIDILNPLLKIRIGDIIREQNRAELRQMKLILLIYESYNVKTKRYVMILFLSHLEA